MRETETKPTTQQRPRRALTAPGDDTGAFTFADIGRRLRVLGEQYEAASDRSMKVVRGSPAWKQLNAAMTQMAEEEIALQSLVLSMQPRTLQDAAVQAGVLFVTTNSLAACDLENEHRFCRLDTALDQIERGAAFLASVVCRLADVNPADAGYHDLSSLLGCHVPSLLEQEAAV